jgi:capsule polysaccharide export protein KpsE/RkpR
MMIPDLVGLKAKLIAGGIALAVATTIFSVQEMRIHWLNEDIKAKDATISTLTGDLAVAEANVETLRESVKRQNTAIGALKAQKAALDAEVREKALGAQKNRQESVSIEGLGVDSMNNFFERLFR